MGLSVPGKLILLGEHAVVYGAPALAVALPDALVVQSAAPRASGIRVSVPAWGTPPPPATAALLTDALRLLPSLLPGEGGLDLVIDARLPSGAGLGSSAALSVLLVRALAHRRRQDLSPTLVRAAAHRLERVFHGTPSGLDDGVVVFGGLCLFQAPAEDPRAPGVLPHAPDLVALPCAQPELLIAESGQPRSTRSLVELVARRRRDDPDTVATLIAAITACVWRGVQAFYDERLVELGAALSECHAHLRALGVSSSRLEDLVRRALRAGALGCKLTGAGGGGCVVALAPERGDAVLRAWREAGYRAHRVRAVAPPSPAVAPPCDQEPRS